MELWQFRQKHSEDYAIAFYKAGCKYFPETPVVRMWIGDRFWEEFNALGHTTIEFDRCECHKPKIERDET